jgi:hypothetical protein
MRSADQFILNQPVKKLVLAVLGIFPLSAFAAPTADSAYMTDPQHSYVEDATSKGIGQVNMITCIMSAMAPDQLVNKGDGNGNYLALVDQAKCDPNMRSSSSNSGSANAAAQASSFMTATVHSSRASNNDPMLVNIWIDDSSDGQASLIFVHTAATAAPTSTNPYGIFHLDFCGKDASNLNSACMMNGYLDGSSNGLSYYQEENRDNGISTTALRLNASSTDAGKGRLNMVQNDNGGSNQQMFSFDYNHDYFLRGDGVNPSQCFSRDANVADASVWRYGVYDANSGARITRNAGFPIEYTPAGGATTYHGYLGYWGVSLPADAASVLQSGDTVQKVDYNGGQAAKVNYTVVKAAGKLMKYTRHTRTLAQIDKIKLNVFVGDASGFFNGANNYTQYQLYWDDAGGTFIVDGRMDCNGGNGCQTAEITPQSVDAAFWISQNGLQGWSQSLGGEVFIDFHGVSAPIDHNNSAAIAVVYRSQDIVYPAEMPANLYCLRDCPTKASIDAYLQMGQHQPGDSPFTLPNQWQAVNMGSEMHYTTNANSALLLDNVAQAVIPANLDALRQDQQFQSGLRSGRLFADLNSVVCDDDPNQYCDYKVNDLTTYYVWETGANSWNQFVAVKDSGNQFVAFDAPLQMSYNVPSGAAYGEYANTSIVLQYGGFGELSGIPGYCVSHLTNATVSCNTQGEDVRYVPAFVIPAGAQVTYTDPTTNQASNVLIKWLEREIRFAAVSSQQCSDLALPSNIVLPTASGLTDPSSTIGIKPLVTDAVRVMHGDVKF